MPTSAACSSCAPAVPYLYPKALTSGCTVEAHAFADTLKRFSVEACRNKFAVAADRGARITKQCDTALWHWKHKAPR